MSFSLPPVLLQLARNPAIAVGLPLVLGMADGQLTKSSLKSWYPTLRQPPGEPPRWAFPVVWTTLYAGMGLASHVLVKALDTAVIGSPTSRLAMSALKLYWVQLALNMAWTPLFFGLRNPTLGLLDILPLTATTYALTAKAAQVDPRLSLIFVPYCAWLSYASYLNGASLSLLLRPPVPSCDLLQPSAATYACARLASARLSASPLPPAPRAPPCARRTADAPSCTLQPASGGSTAAVRTSTRPRRNCARTERRAARQSDRIDLFGVPLPLPSSRFNFVPFVLSSRNAVSMQYLFSSSP